MAPISVDRLRALALETGMAYRIWGESINEAAIDEIGDVQYKQPGLKTFRSGVMASGISGPLMRGLHLISEFALHVF
jgi:hypothetical protein